MIQQVFEAVTTVGELKKQLEQFTDETSFGFLNQPMQQLHRYKSGDFEGAVFQQPLYPHQFAPAVKKYWPEGKHPDSCKGECMITATCGIDFCSLCSWCEYEESLW